MAMKIVLRILSVLFVAIAAFLLIVVISVAADSGTDLRTGVAIGYVIGAAVLIAAAVAMWRSTSKPGGSA
jgi:peptidoglycan/LPS O-acetylase OafA/YrhL